MSKRESNGKFAKGNPGGPGRPRRAIEREYLATLAEVVPLDIFRKIVERAISDALNGDARARDWLARHLLGVTPIGLTDLAAAEQNGLTTEKVVQQRADELKAKADARRPYAFDPDDEAAILRGLVVKRDALQPAARRQARQ